MDKDKLMAEMVAALKEARILLEAVAPVMARKGTHAYTRGAQLVNNVLSKVE